MNSRLKDSLEALRKRTEHTKMMPDQKIKPESDPLIVDVLFALAE